MLNEFEIIRRYFKRSRPGRDDVLVGIDDDAAVLRVPAGSDLVSAIDTLVEGRHFPVGAAARDIGWKALAVNLSDLAAMGAAPAWFTLALTVPDVDEAWLQAFADGLFELAESHGVALVGGDTTRGPLTVSIAIHGLVPVQGALLRRGAQPGDIVCVTGTLGDAALALERTLRGESVDDALVQRLSRPQPRLAAGRALRPLAHAGIDISDGLAADLTHLLQASGVGATLDVDKLPLSVPLRELAGAEAARLALSGGDDYELCVCLPEAQLVPAQAAVAEGLTPIGRIEPEPGLRLVDAAGRSFALQRAGYAHFG